MTTNPAIPPSAVPVLVLSGDPVGELMAGPAIRAVELARTLGHAGHPVILAVPAARAVELPATVSVVEAGTEQLPALAEDVSVVAAFAAVAASCPWLADVDAMVVIDAYDPGLLETLERRRGEPVNAQRDWVRAAASHLVDPLAFADVVLVASDRQRHLVLGLLAALGRLSPRVLAEDAALDRLVRTVPFGIPPEPPTPGQARPISGPGGVLPGVAHVALWGGGLYDWLDPVTLVEAVARCPDDIGAVFLAGPHPTPAVGPVALVDVARQRAATLGLLGTRVAFHERWVPYAHRGDWLTDAAVGVSLHHRHLETEMAFRTRILDYIWAGLPVLCSAGDTMAELVERHGIGIVVPPGDVRAVASALMALRGAGPGQRGERTSRLATVARELAWPEVTRPLVEACAQPRMAPDRRVATRPPGRLRQAVSVLRGLPGAASARW